MKKIIALISLAFITLNAFSQAAAPQTEETPAEENEIPFNNAKKISFVFNEGVSLLEVTRIQKAKETDHHSNYVWNDSMIGIYSSVQTQNFPVSDWYFRLQALYPFQHQFNGMETFAKQTILYAFDFFFGMPFHFTDWKYVNLTFTPGLHGMYQLSDEYHLGYFGGGAIIGMEFPLTKRWTLLYDGTFTFDYPNLGSNSLVQPFKMSWTWQTSLGIRYSRVKNNKYHYFRNK